MKTYSVDSKVMYWLFVAVIPCLMVGFGSLWIWLTARDASQDRGVIWFGVLWMIAVLWGCYRQVTMPHSIEVTETGTIRFVGAFRTSNVEPSTVISIKSWAGPFVEVRHAGGKILLLRQFTGFYQFLSELREANPNVAVRGL